MIEVPKLVVILLVGFLVWYALRWVNGPAARRTGRARPTSSRPRQSAIEDLVACRACGAFVASGAGSCGKPGCPQPLLS
jgi:hypothetical protein